MLRALILLLLAAPALAQTTLYRCGNLYTDKPCEGAKLIEVYKDQNVFPSPPQRAEYVAPQVYTYPVYIGGSGYATGFNYGGGYDSGQRYGLRYGYDSGHSHDGGNHGGRGGGHGGRGGR